MSLANNLRYKFMRSLGVSIFKRLRSIKKKVLLHLRILTLGRCLEVLSI